MNKRCSHKRFILETGDLPLFVRVFAITTFLTFVSSPAFAEQCQTREAALAMMKTVQAESANSRSESAKATEAFRIQMNEKGAALGWDEEKKSAVFREMKSTERFVLLETQINKMRQDMLDLNKTVNLSNLQADPAGTCSQIQSIRTLIRQIDLKSRDLRSVKQSYLAAIKK